MTRYPGSLDDNGHVYSVVGELAYCCRHVSTEMRGLSWESSAESCRDRWIPLTPSQALARAGVTRADQRCYAQIGGHVGPWAGGSPLRPRDPLHCKATSDRSPVLYEIRHVGGLMPDRLLYTGFRSP